MNRFHHFYSFAAAGAVALIGISFIDVAGAESVADGAYAGYSSTPVLIARNLKGHPPYKRHQITAPVREKAEFARFEEVSRNADKQGASHRHIKGHPPYRRDLTTSHK